MIMNILKRIISVMDIAVFVFTTTAIAGIAYPAITLLLWYFYLWFLYGTILVGRYFVKKTSAKQF